MEIQLKKLSESQFPDFIEQLIEDYAQGMSANYGIDIVLARVKARNESMGMLNPELNIKKNHLNGIIDNSTGETVGGLLYTVNEEMNSAFGCQLIIFEQYRRKGYAKAALEKLEFELKEKGITKFKFNVFANNEGAFKLYEKLGYRPTSTYMAKTLK